MKKTFEATAQRRVHLAGAIGCSVLLAGMATAQSTTWTEFVSINTSDVAKCPAGQYLTAVQCGGNRCWKMKAGCQSNAVLDAYNRLPQAGRPLLYRVFPPYDYTFASGVEKGWDILISTEREWATWRLPNTIGCGSHGTA